MLLTAHAQKVSLRGGGTRWCGLQISIPLPAGTPPAWCARGWWSDDGSLLLFFFPAAIEEMEKKVGFAVPEDPGSVFERYCSCTLQCAIWFAWDFAFSQGLDAWDGGVPA